MAPSPSPRRLIDVLPTMELPIQFDHDRVVAFCRERGIVRLSVFGSVLRDDFDLAHSDIDVLADFKPEATRGIGFRFFRYGDELAEILGRQSTSAHDWPRVSSRPCAAKPLRSTRNHGPSCPRITLAQIRDEA